ncbi:hypothetical protein MMC07_007249 [Pseudocyphellaria aurata]|nr:hypothetical protein [Pseudocyphellaria aurata]
MNPANGSFGGMGLMNNVTNGATSRASSDQEENDFEARLNTYIYDFFVRSENYDCARTLLRSGVAMEPQVRRREDMNGDDSMHTDSKDDLDSKRPDDLPAAPFHSENSFLLDWFSCFWDFYFARSKNTKASQQAMQYLQHTQQQSRIRQEQQQQLLRSAPMMPANMGEYQNMLRFQQAGVVGLSGDLRQKALQNRTAFGHTPTPQQLAQLAGKQQQMMAQQQMRRDPSDLDINVPRPRTPSSGENAPSPSKRARLEGVPGFNGPQMMPNGRGPPQGLQGQQMMTDHSENANSLLMQHGINPTGLTQPQYNSFANSTPQVQAKSMQVYNQNMAVQQQRQNMPKPRIPGQGGSPMMQPGIELTGAAPNLQEYFNVNPGMAMRPQPNGVGGGNHALQDYQMQLMLLEQQNKKRLLMARQEHDTTPRPDGQPGGMPGAPGFAPVMSPQGSRSGPSPGPNDQIKRGTPKMGASVLPNAGSPMPDGSMQQGRESPAAMNYNGQMPQEIYPTMKMGEGMRPPSSHPRFNGMNREQMEAVRVSQMQNGGWAPQPGQAAMMQQIPQAQQPAQSTPQQRTMPPPPPTTLPAGATANGRPASPAVPALAPQTPSATAKPNPKAKKTDEKTRKRPPKKTTGGAPAAPAPTNEPENPPPTPPPAAPGTPMNPNSFSKQNEPANAAGLVAGSISTATSAPLAQPQPDPNVTNFMALDESNQNDYSIGNFGTDMSGDVLENFDFDSFLQNTEDGGFNFNAAGLNFANTDGVEAVAGDA